LSIVLRVIMGPVDLAVEVVSLGGRYRVRFEKSDLYVQLGVREFWIIDPDPETVDVLAMIDARFELAMRCGPGQHAASRLLSGFQISVDDLFHEK
jgi:Uma2 family endonuclease